jgi:hypothetical protein
MEVSMKYSWLIGLVVVGCNIQVKHKGLDGAVPKSFTIDSDNDVETGVDFDQILEYCTGRVDHAIALETRENPDFVMSEEDRQFEIDDCYYNFDLIAPENLRAPEGEADLPE